MIDDAEIKRLQAIETNARRLATLMQQSPGFNAQVLRSLRDLQGALAMPSSDIRDRSLAQFNMQRNEAIRNVADEPGWVD